MKADKNQEKPNKIWGKFMSLKNTIAILGSAAILSSPAYALNKNFTNAQSLEATVMQEQSQEDQRYLDIKKQFDDADTVVYGVADKLAPDKKPFEYNDFYKNICAVYSLRDVMVHKFNSVVLKPSKRFVNTVTNDPMNLIITYNATKPGAPVEKAVIDEAQKAGLASPATDDNTPVLEEGKEYFVFLQKVAARKGTRRGILSYIEATQENKDILERIVNDYKKGNLYIPDNSP